MSVLPHRMAILGIATAVTLAFAGCSGTDADTAGGQLAAPAAEIPAVSAEYLRTATVVALSDPEVKLSVSVPSITKAPALALAVQSVRNSTIRSFRQEKGVSLDMSWQVLGSSGSTVGISLTTRRVDTDVTTTDTTGLWYDQSTRTVHTSPGLVEPARWEAFVDEVVHAVSNDAGLDAPRARTALGQVASLWGEGPMLTFDAEGNAVVVFDSGVLKPGAQLVKVRVPGDNVLPMLSRLGKRARVAAMYPSSFDGTGSSKKAERPDGTPSETSTRPSTGLARDCVKQRCVALSFDDGPSPFTATIARTVSDNGGGATFFVVGDKIIQDPLAVRRVALMGSEVQGHGWRHRAFIYDTDASIADSFTRSGKAIESAAGLTSTLVRPPDGASSTRVQAAAKKSGVTLIKWSVDTRDWESRDAELTIEHAVTGVRPGHIILMSDLYPSTAEAVPGIIARLKEQGFTLVPVSELTEPNAWLAGGVECAAPGTGVACGN